MEPVAAVQRMRRKIGLAQNSYLRHDTEQDVSVAQYLSADGIFEPNPILRLSLDGRVLRRSH